jgi:hypothetical protein
MEVTFKVEKTVEIKKVKVEVAVRYEDEDIPYDFPLREGDMWNATIDVDNGKILDWPQGKSGDLHMKICDEGTYHLLDENDNIVLSIIEDYVPNSLLPGEYGDYLFLKINEEGVVTNWMKDANFSEFTQEED